MRNRSSARISKYLDFSFEFLVHNLYKQGAHSTVVAARDR